MDVGMIDHAVERSEVALCFFYFAGWKPGERPQISRRLHVICNALRKRRKLRVDRRRKDNQIQELVIRDAPTKKSSASVR